jgi:predicted MFS family arabinose efflux permease
VTRRQCALALILLASLNAFGFIDRVVVALIAEKVKAEFLISDLEIGLLGGTAFALVNTLASLPIARLAERFNRARVTTVFLMLGSLFTALAGLSASFGHLLACRLGMAVGSAATEAPPHSMISDMYPPEKRASAISIFMLGVPVAALLGSFAGGAIAESFGWRNTFLFFGLLGGGISLLCFAFLKEPARSIPEEASGARKSAFQIARMLLGSTTLRFMVGGVSCISLGSFGVNTFLPAFFSREFALDAGQAGLAFGLISGSASLVGTLVGGFASEAMARRDPRWLLGVPALGLVVGAPVFLVGLNAGTLIVAVPLMLLGSCSFYTAMGPAIATLHGSLDSFSRATGSALFLLVMHLIGQGIGPPLVGGVSDIASGLLYGGGNFALDCAGAAAQVQGSACASASAGGLRYAIMIFAIFFVGGGLMLFLAAQAGHRFRKNGTV